MFDISLDSLPTRILSGGSAVPVLILYYILQRWFIEYEITGSHRWIGPKGASIVVREFFITPELFTWTGWLAGFLLGRSVLAEYPFGLTVIPAEELIMKAELVAASIAGFMSLKLGYFFLRWRIRACLYRHGLNWQQRMRKLWFSRIVVTATILSQGVCIWVFAKTLLFGIAWMSWL
jgi:hypothetical protein